MRRKSKISPWALRLAKLFLSEYDLVLPGVQTSFALALMGVKETEIKGGLKAIKRMKHDATKAEIVKLLEERRDYDHH